MKAAKNAVGEAMTVPPVTGFCLIKTGLKLEAEAWMKAQYPEIRFEVLTLRELRLRPAIFLRFLGRRWDLAAAFVADLEACPFPEILRGMLAMVPARRRLIVDRTGRVASLGRGAVLYAAARLCGEAVWTPYLMWCTTLGARAARKGPVGNRHGRGYHLLYLRADAWEPLKAGGSVAHTRGVLYGLREYGFVPTVVSPTPLPGVAEAGFSEVVISSAGTLLRNVPDLNLAEYGRTLTRRLLPWAAQRPWAFLYQRASLLNWSGMEVARRCGIPFILEFNGPEIWVNQHWGHPLLFRRLAGRVERANLLQADLIIVVSRPLEAIVLAEGVDPERILVNPNGVDPDEYHPAISVEGVRARLGLKGRLVIGFVGTFGRWHGAEILARATPRILNALPAAHVLFVGDGNTMPDVRAALEGTETQQGVSFTGLVPPSEAREYMAACDILVSPHVPNPDGTPFFGSPTKLFEYMAMGKAIVASDLDQIGEVLSHAKTAWLVRPGDADDLAAGIIELARDPELRAALGKTARQEAVAKYTWKAHVGRILQKMVELHLIGEEASVNAA